jgi:hypothetical protein
VWGTSPEESGPLGVEANWNIWHRSILDAEARVPVVYGSV